MCYERETLLKLNLFQLMQQHRSWDKFLISIYWIDAHDLKTEMRMRASIEKNGLHLSMNSVFKESSRSIPEPWK